jgi:triosephosphate isomerase (TIM)
MIFINFKTYQEATGKNALVLGQIIEEVATTTQTKIVPVVGAMDVKELATALKVEVWTQKIDPVSYGAFTGAIIPEAVFEDGAKGTFLNHSENKFTDYGLLEKAVLRAKEVGLKTLIFASDLDELKKVILFKPDFVSYEPPELIGSQSVSVATAKPEIVAQAVEIANSYSIPLIVGAGIAGQEDVKKSLELGATGVAVASAVVKAQDQKAKLIELTEGFK